MENQIYDIPEELKRGCGTQVSPVVSLSLISTTSLYLLLQLLGQRTSGFYGKLNEYALYVGSPKCSQSGSLTCFFGHSEWQKVVLVAFECL